MADEKPWQDKETLERLYWEELMTWREIAEHLDTTKAAIQYWFDKHEIPTRVRGDDSAGAEYRDEETLRRLYVEEGMSTYDIGDLFGVAGKTIQKWLRRNGIPARESNSEKPPAVGIGSKGYMRIQHNDGEKVRSCATHQLIAIANGEDPYKVFSGGEYNCHHKNGMKIDNRHENVELRSVKEHAEAHGFPGD